jgi:hypothetical protein
MLQACLLVIHFKRILDFGEGHPQSYVVFTEIRQGQSAIAPESRANRKLLRARSLRVVSEARRAMRLQEHGVFKSTYED